MVESTSEATESVLEAAAMDMTSTNQSNVEGNDAPNTGNGYNGQASTNGHSPVTNDSTNQSAEVKKPMEENTSQPSKTNQPGQSNVSSVYGNYEDYQLLPDAPWPAPIFIRQSISPQERYYVEHRWYSQWSFFDKKATENKNRYYRTQLVVGIGSVTVPVLVGINASEPIADTVLYFITVFISLSVAMATAIESLYTFGDNWRSYRSAAEDMYQEKSLYDVKAGRYTNSQQAFIRFVERCEEIIAQQNGRWVQSQEKAAEQMAQDAEEFTEIYGGKKRSTDEFGNPLSATIASTSTSITQSTPDGHSVTQTETTVSEVVETAPITETYTPDPSTTLPASATETYVDPNVADAADPTSFG